MTITPVQINAPHDAHVSNYLFEDMEPFELNQGLLLVELSNGFSIDVGWFPENDPAGHFIIKVSSGWDEGGETRCTTVDEVVERVHRLIEHYNGSVVKASNATNRKLMVAKI